MGQQCCAAINVCSGLIRWLLSWQTVRSLVRKKIERILRNSDDFAVGTESLFRIIKNLMRNSSTERHVASALAPWCDRWNGRRPAKTAKHSAFCCVLFILPISDTLSPSVSVITSWVATRLGGARGFEPRPLHCLCDLCDTHTRPFLRPVPRLLAADTTAADAITLCISSGGRQSSTLHSDFILAGPWGGLWAHLPGNIAQQKFHKSESCCPTFLQANSYF